MKTMKVEYRQEDTILEAFIAYNEEGGISLPAVCVFPAWNGRDGFAEDKALALARIGYVGCAMDVYGKGIKADTASECAHLMNPLMEDRSLLRKRILAGFEMVSSLPFVDKEKIGAIGFCFGGLCALDLARSGAALRGVVSFHGLLKAPPLHLTCSPSCKVLVLHGFDDPMVRPHDVLAFEEEMTSYCVDWQLHSYGGVMHAFTNPLACAKEMGLLYSAVADKRSWHAMKGFFEEIF